jgi:hypothetical protein
MGIIERPMVEGNSTLDGTTSPSIGWRGREVNRGPMTKEARKEAEEIRLHAEARRKAGKKRPYPRVSKNKHPHLRQAKLVKALTDPNSPTFGNQTQSALAAGYSKGYHASVAVSRPGTREAVLAAMERAGITEDLIAQSMKQGIEAKSVTRIKNRVTGEVETFEDPDHTAIPKYLDMALNVRDNYPKKDAVDPSTLILRIPDGTLSVEEWHRKYEVKQPKLLTEKDYIDAPIESPGTEDVR